MNKVIDPETYIFNFGKNIGKTYADVASSEPVYILWCHHWADWFTVKQEDLDNLLIILPVKPPQYRKKANPFAGNMSPATEYALEVNGDHNCYGI